MKFSKLGFVSALCVAGIMGSTAALAADSGTVAVSAAVSGVCKFGTGGGLGGGATGSTLAFGTLDQVGGGAVNGVVATQPKFWCTKNVTWNITDDNGANESGTTHRLYNGTDYIPYTFTYTTTGSGTGKTSPIDMDIAGTIAEVDYVDVSAGAYTDTVTLTIDN